MVGAESTRIGSVGAIYAWRTSSTLLCAVAGEDKEFMSLSRRPVWIGFKGSTDLPLNVYAKERVCIRSRRAGTDEPAVCTVLIGCRIYINPSQRYLILDESLIVPV